MASTENRLKALEEAAEARRPKPEAPLCYELLATSELVRLRSFFDKAGETPDGRLNVAGLTDDELEIVHWLTEKCRPGADRTNVNIHLREVNARVPWPPPPCRMCDDQSGRPLTPAERGRAADLLSRYDSWPRRDGGWLVHEGDYAEWEQLNRVAAVGEL